MNPKIFRFIRQSKGLTQQEMADMLGVSQPLVGLIERNKKNISDKVNRRLRETFGSDYIEKCRAFLGQ